MKNTLKIKRKKLKLTTLGFTLVELLAVVSIISILLLLVAPKIVNQLNNSKNDVNDVTKKIIYSAAEKYIKDNNMKIEYDYCLSVEELQDKEYLSNTITDNKSGLDISKKSVRITPKDNSKYEYELTSECNAIATQEDYRGYYADVDGDGTVDGIIYADLAHSQSGQWVNVNGHYSYTKKENLNEYTISGKVYKKNAGFGENKVIKLKTYNNNSRFYVMALEDFREGSFEEGDRCSSCSVGEYYWYKNGQGKISLSIVNQSFGTGYANTGKIIEIWNKNETGAGSYSEAMQDEHDIFKVVQSEYAKGWYIPSQGEWAAFAHYFSSKVENALTTSNCNIDYGLQSAGSGYWSSSVENSVTNYSINFTTINNQDTFDGISIGSFDGASYVRLGATF